MATFTHDLAAATGDREIAVLLSPGRGVPYPLEVHHRIRRDERSDYGHTARALGACVDVVSIQHDYDIWGGDDGEYVIDFVRALDVPAIATLHTILPAPTASQRAILTELIASVEATVVMSKSAKALLATAYGVDTRRVDVIPHGVPELPVSDPETIKAAVDLDGREVILSFGLIGPDKGLELAIDALPAVVAEHPSVCYAIVGPTHPDLLAAEGESYREALVARIKALKMVNHVRFVDRFVGRVELTRWLQASDVVVTPYPNLDRIVSGTLSYAMGAGRAIVSTPYAYAAELLADGRGVLVPPGSPAPFAAALNEVLGDRKMRTAIGQRAYKYSRDMVWSSVGAKYNQLIGRVGATPQAPALVTTLGMAATVA